MEDRRESSRVFFGEQKWKVSIIISREVLEAGFPSQLTPWDLSADGMSFITDVPLRLDGPVNVLLAHPQLENALDMTGRVVRIDQIRELDNPVISYKIALKFENQDTQVYESIRGLTV